MFASPLAQPAQVSPHAPAHAFLHPMPVPRPTAVPGVGAFRAMLDAIDVGMLVCDDQGRLVHANAAAEGELRQGQLLRLQPDQHLSAPTLVQRDRLMLALAAAIKGRHQLMELKLGPQRLALSIQPLVLAGSETTVHALVLLGRRTVAPELAVAMLCRLYDMTNAEQRVLAGLLKGVRVTQLALEHQVKVSTIRTQVSTLRAKLGVRRMEDALRLVAELPPMAGALRCGA